MAQFIKGAGLILTEEEKENLKEAMVMQGTNRPLMPNLRKAVIDGFVGWGWNDDLEGMDHLEELEEKYNPSRKN
jgi:hypothetical protein